MESSTNSQTEPVGGNSAAGETPGSQPNPQPPPERHAFLSFRDAIRRGADDARTAAEKTIPKVKSAAADAAYWTAYGVSFATVFHWVMAKGLVPEPVKSGLRDGVLAAEEAARKWTEKLRQRKEPTTDAGPEQAGPATSAVQPGAA